MGNRWKAVLAGAIAAAGLACGGGAQEPQSLKAPSEFAGIADPSARSAALFEEAGKVLLHPRCLNCHPAGERPTQGDDLHPHEPRVRRGPENQGVAGLHCPACHQAKNFDAVTVTVPGHPKWQLAPLEMAWQGKSLAEICAQVKDPARNGHHTLSEIVEHGAHDDLVAWGWDPGAGRAPAPGTQARFGELLRAWADSGAHCPGS
jgi:cytochrome c5